MHPSLARLYQCSPHSEFLYFDETYTAPEDPFHDRPFYALTAVQFKYEDHSAIRQDIQEIVGASYFHSTESLRSSTGQAVFEELVRYCSENKDPSFVTCNVDLAQDSNIEDARRECIKHLISEYAVKIPYLEGFIFEARRENKDNNRDRRFLKHLREEKILPDNIGSAWVSPHEEKLLWVPDLVCMAYRRSMTHQDRTSIYFSEYLEDFTKVYEFSLNK